MHLKQYLFQGHLGSLGAIPDRYDVAISMACDALHNMVVDTVSQGQACTNFLCSQNVGRASFVILKELSTNRLRERVQTPEKVPRFEQDRIRRHKEMEGRDARWTVDRLVRDHVVRWESRVTRGVRTPSWLLRQYKAFKGEVEQLMLAGPQMEVDNKKLTMDVNNSRKRLTESKSNARDMGASTHCRGRSHTELQISRRSRQNRKLPKTLAKTSRKILDIGGFRLLRRQSTIEGIKLHINLANDEITKAEVAKAKAGKGVIKHDSAIAMNVTNVERSTKS
ncbi:hypothetical protein BU15DRAFT_83284 [Melanogaster broomeanus]|nr:hypothetical protein BU15DRAFT_83284 [Melanogaster broomeanus]